MKCVIIGYSVAAVNAIKAIRTLDNGTDIYVVSNEEKLYSRPLISYYLAGKLSEDQLSFVEEDFEKQYNVKVFCSTEAEYIDTKRKQVRLDNKNLLSYDKLLITVGGKPIIPNIKGLNGKIEGIFTFTKLKDAKNLLYYIKKNKIKQAVILGGGLIGMKAAEGLLANNIKLKIIDITDRLLSTTFDKTASSYIENKLIEFGSEFIPENTIEAISVRNKKLYSVQLRNGKKINTQLLIIAVGVRPNLDLIKDTKIKFNKGVLVNEFLQTNFEDIYSAGDVVETKNFITGEHSVLAIWPAASVQGRIAGLNMVKKVISYDGMYSMNAVDILGIPSISFGVTNVDEKDGFEILSKKEKNSYKKIVLKENKVVGIILVGNIDRAGLYGILIKEKIDVSKFKNELLKDDFGFLVLPKDFRKHLVIGENIEI
ncbi:MAG: FAD-dependent oxidoreductase [Endomicrobia bacterium]|nr:FAD-dependent oxidoreductase [Endomicrobiia bacterium]